MKTISKQKNTVRSMVVFYILPFSLIYCFNRRHMDFQYCFYVQSILICCLFEVYKENPAVHRYIGEKGWMEYFTIFSCNCEYSLLHQNSKSGRFLKVSCSVAVLTLKPYH